MKCFLPLTILLLNWSSIHAQKVYLEKVPSVTVMECFPGGNDSLVRFIRKNFKNPDVADSISINGCISVAFKISEEGYAKDFVIKKKIGYGYEEELVRVLKLMPKWFPKKEDGNAVESDYIAIPICFRSGE